MFYRQASNQYINEGQSFTVNGVTYPSNWLNQATLAQKEALGLVEVVATNQPFNPKYYWTGETLNGAELTYTGTAKELEQVKQDAIKEADATAYSILLPTDFIEARNLRDPLYKPEWMTWRDSIRTTFSSTETAVKACTTVDAVATVMSNIVWAKDPSNAV